MRNTDFFSGVVELARDGEFERVFGRYGTVLIYHENGSVEWNNVPQLMGEYVLTREGLYPKNIAPETSSPIIDYNADLVGRILIEPLVTNHFGFKVVLERKEYDVYYTEFQIGLPDNEDVWHWVNMLIDAIIPGIDWNRYWAMREIHFLYRLDIDYLLSFLYVLSRTSWKFENLKYVRKGELIYALLESGIPLRHKNGKIYAGLYRIPYYKEAITEVMSQAKRIRELAKYIGVNENNVIITWFEGKIYID